MSTARESEPTATTHAQASVEADPAEKHDQTSSADSAVATDAKASPDDGGALGPAPNRIDAGAIPRSTLNGVLASGVGRFLQKVRARAQLERGHFVGWRLVQIEGGGHAALRAGDTVLSVNGQGIERPEQFKDVWDKVASHPELVLLVQRDGQQRELHYRIVD